MTIVNKTHLLSQHLAWLLMALSILVSAKLTEHYYIANKDSSGKPVCTEEGLEREKEKVRISRSITREEENHQCEEREK